MKHKTIYLIMLCLLICSVRGVKAQDTARGYVISGTVMDESGEPLPGVNIVIKDGARGTISDTDGRFKLEGTALGDTVVFSFIGFKNHEMVVKEDRTRLKIALKAQIDELDQVVVVGHGTQRKITTTGAITSIDASRLQVPAVSVSNMLAGRVPGVIGLTRSGEPGDDYSEFWIRGISTFGANSGALVLIDGVEGNLNDLDPVDIESFSILKDASATAVYGVRGANGVVLVTTKRGKAGKLKINFKANRTYTECARLPEYVDAPTYARLSNEARVVRGLDRKYTDVEIELFDSGLDPDLYPNVNWRDVILKDHSYYGQYNLNISGGGTNARYYVSLGYQNKDGIFKQDDSANKYDVNVNYHKYNFRSNVDMDLGSSTKLQLSIEDVISEQNSPGYGDNNNALWSAQANLTPVTVPVKYSNGQMAAYGSNGNQITPYALLNYTGYDRVSKNTVNLKMRLTQNLDVITKGLDVNGLFSWTYYGSHSSGRSKMPELYYATGRQNDGSLITKKTVSESDASYWQSAYIERSLYFEGQINYNRLFNDKHRITGLVHAYRQDERNSSGSGYDDVIPVRYQAISGRATYSYKDTYLAEVNGGYSGSENFKPGEQYGFFPAFSLGWIPTQYHWTKEHIPFINYFKIRASWGKVGNGETNERFPYLSLMNYSSNEWGGTVTEGKVGVDNLKWETTTKYDIGVDAKFYKERFDLTVDWFLSEADDIYQQRVTIPYEAGAAQSPWVNAGSMRSWGADGNIAYSQPIGKDMSLTVRGNFTFSRNKVTHWEQTGINYPYQSYTGVPYGVQRGLIALGLFKDEEDIAASPVQTFMSNYLPGDIKYKDVNGDGIIDSDDEVPLDYSNVPRLEYGFAAELNYRRWTFSVFFTGQDQVSYFLGGDGYYPFNGEEQGNILSIAANQQNRWTPASYSGSAETENPGARFPRLTYGWNANNNRNSTFWLADASFLRFKNAEIAYRFDQPWLKEHGISSATLSLTANNIAVWDDVELWDPEQASSNGAVYPLQRTYTLQLNVSF
jgi:TonB-linked SusC/RagA family outer membrane protein